MEINVKNTDCFGTGKFVLNESKTPYSIFKDSDTIFLTQEGNESLKKEILKLIGECQQVLKICSFIITDREIYHALLDKAQNTNVALFIITELDQKKLTNISTLVNYLTEDELKENSGQKHLKYIKRLFDSGVHIRAAESIHAKFIVSDREKGLITSANITTPSLTLNTESGVYLGDDDVKELDRLFDIVFMKGTTYRQFLASEKKNKIFVVQADIKIEPSFLPDWTKSGLRFTYENIENNLYREIINIINKATDYIYLSTFSIRKLLKLPEFINAVKEAISRGVNVNVFCRGMNHRNDHLEGTEILNSLGCSIYADLFNHSKGIINQDSGLIFTANIDGNRGLKKGFEVGCLLSENQRMEFLKFHQYLINTAYYHYDAKPTRINVFQTYSRYEKEKNITPPAFPKDITITVKNGIRINENEIWNDLLFYGRKGKDEFLICGDSIYRCFVKEGEFQLVSLEDPRFDLERYVLKYQNLKIIVN